MAEIMEDRAFDVQARHTLRGRRLFRKHRELMADGLSAHHAESFGAHENDPTPLPAEYTSRRTFVIQLK